jgi:hypothetical protein
MPDNPTIPASDGPGERLLQTDAPARRRRWPGIVGTALMLLVIAIALIAAVAPGVLPASSVGAGTRKVAAAAIFAASYLALAIGYPV